MFDIGWIGDLALGAAALSQVRGLRKDVRSYMTANDQRHEGHERRLGFLEGLTALVHGGAVPGKDK